MFKGFTPNAWKFFRDLKRNNRKPWYLKEKHRFDTYVAAPAIELATALSNARGFRKLGLHTLRPEKALFRMHRDLRFSHDKSPYKTYNGLSLSRSGSKKDTGSFYLHLDPDEFFACIGFYQLDSALLLRFRSWLASDPRAKKTLAYLKKAKLELAEEDRLVRPPRGFEQISDPVLADALKNRHFLLMLPLSTKDLSSPKVVAKIEAFVLKAEPFMRQGWELLDEWRAEGGDPDWQAARAKLTERRFKLMEADY
jgi:uncharacterized protein (TIGR02453 family)